MHQDSRISGSSHVAGGEVQASTTSADVADLIVAYLTQIGVDRVFGIPGGAIQPLYEALVRGSRNGGPKPVIACHEAGAAFMADGYARETGKLGVCWADFGPATTSLITGVACAHENGVPLLVLTGQPSLAAVGNLEMQDAACAGVDTLSMFRHCTRYNTLVSHVKQVETKLVNAMHKALQAPGGAAHLGFPVDILRAAVASATPSYHPSSLWKPSSVVDECALNSLLEAIREAKGIVLLIGGWCAEAIEFILRFAERHGASLVVTQDGKALVNPGHPLFRGIVGYGGDASAAAALQDPSVHLILAIGFRMSGLTVDESSAALLHGRLVHIDESEEHLCRTPMARLHVRGRILTIFQALIERLDEPVGDGRICLLPDRSAAAGSRPQTNEPPQPADEAALITPQHLLQHLGRHLAPTARYVTDTGNSLLWAMHFLRPQERRIGERHRGGSGRQGSVDRRIRSGGRLAGSMLRATTDFAPAGYAIGAAAGTAAGSPDNHVVCITGNRGMLTNGQEISVAVMERFNLLYVVFNETVSASPAVDFAAFARALGAHAYVVETLRDLQAIDFDAVFRRDGPTLLDVHLVPEAATSDDPSEPETLTTAAQE